MESDEFSVALRATNETDRIFLRKLYAAARLDEFIGVGWDAAQIENFLAMQFDLQSRAYRMQFPGAAHSIIESEKTAIGRLIVYRGASENRLVDIAIVPEFRGRGIGARLVGELQREAAAENKTLRLRVLKTNRRAVAFYERCGFVGAADEDLYWAMIWRSEAIEEKIMLETKSYEEFAAQVGTKFQILDASAAPISDVVLNEVTKRKSSGRQEYFSLLFLGANEGALTQQTYRIKHEKLGEGMLFLVPVGQDAAGVQYEAAFNRLIENEKESETVELSD